MKPTDDEIVLALAADLAEYHRTVLRAHEKGICVACGEFAAPRIYSPEGRAEYQISGMCEVCFDDMFEGRME